MEASERKQNRAFVVLGMHRSGTSASMRGLMTLGVDVGSRLIPPVKGENPKGFFEDARLLEISDRVLEVLGLTWDSPCLVPGEAWQGPALQALEQEAVEEIRNRFAGVPDFGFKNPRTARLLPFWKRVFERAGREPHYVVVLRNPLSVARSLRVRNGLTERRALLLWLLHVTDAVVHTRGMRRVCLDYDTLIDSPKRELDRVARAIGLEPIRAESAEWQAFEQEFLSSSLRNSRFEPADLDLSPELSALAVTAYRALESWSKQEGDASTASLQQVFGRIRGQLERMAPVLADLAATEVEKRNALVELSAASAAAEERSTLLNRLQAEIGDREQALEAIRLRHAQLEGDLAAQQRAVDQGRERIAWLQSQIEHAQQESAASRERLDLSRQELEAARAGAEDLAVRKSEVEQEVARQVEQNARLREECLRLEAARDDLLAARQGLEAAHRNELDAATEASRAEIRDRERALDQARMRLARFESERFEERRAAAALKHELSAAQSELERVKDLRDLEAERDRIWLREQSNRWVSEIVTQIEGIERSRQWRTTAPVQRLVSRLRGRPWEDGLAEVRRLALALQAETAHPPVDVGRMAWLMADLRRTVRDFSAGEIFRLSRLGATFWHAIRLSSRPEGPFEFVQSRVAELLVIFEHLSVVPSAERNALRIDAKAEAGTGAANPSIAESASVGPSPIVDVVVPVYRAREQTLRCLESVLSAHCRTPHEIIVIDDGGGDAELSRELGVLARSGAITLLENERNLGFPATANRGLQLHSDRDVILLNSDTLVHGDWIDRLRRAAHADWKVASVTPLSNNAEICSYPSLCQSSPMPSHVDLAALDDATAVANRALTVTLPTAVGFCMYIRRDALREVGLFDADRFGRGYGEENDFCLRARGLGYRHVLAADVFVAHEGGVSFSDAKTELIAQGLAELGRLYPDYPHQIHDFIVQDPVRAFRRRLDLARLAPRGRPSMLMVSHAKGGGTHRHVVELAAHLEREGIHVLLLQPSGADCVRLSRPGSSDAKTKAAENLEYRLPEDFEALVEGLRLADVRHVHIHHLLGLDASVLELASALGCEFDATLHDYLAICPRVHLMGDGNRFCGVPRAAACGPCIKRNGSEAGFEVDIESWRADHHRWLVRARKVFVPSEDTRARLAPFLPDVELIVRAHPEEYSGGRVRSAPRDPKEPRRVAVIGAIGPHKGSEFLVECAADAADRELPIEFHLIGYSDRDDALRETKKVTITGPYREDALEGLLERARCDVALIPSLWPETFCYTLSAALRSPLFPVGFDLGAIGERIAQLGWGESLPLGVSASEVNDRILGLDSERLDSPPDRRGLGVRYDGYLSNYYAGLEERYSLPAEPIGRISS